MHQPGAARRSGPRVANVTRCATQVNRENRESRLSRSLRTVALVMLPISTLALTGCVTERLPRPLGTSPYVKGDPSQPPTGISAPQAKPTGVPGALRFEIAALGEVRFDSSTLPLVSPGGGFIAVQSGIAPPEAAADASGPAEALQTRIEIYDMRSRRLERTFIAGSPARSGVPRVLTQGMLLGRSVNDEGFLVEWPRQDATRWIGLCSWKDASIRWLIGGDESSPTFGAHAVLLRDGSLVTALGDETATGWLLARRSASGQIAVLDERPATMIVPVTSLDATQYSFLRLDGGVLRHWALGTPQSPSLRIVAEIGTDRTIRDAINATSSVPPTGAFSAALWTDRDSFTSQYAGATGLFNSLTGRLQFFWMDGSTAAVDLPPESISAAPGRTGMLVTSVQELTIWPRRGVIGGRFVGGASNLMRKPGVIRAVWGDGMCAVEPGREGNGWILVSKFTHPTNE